MLRRRECDLDLEVVGAGCNALTSKVGEHVLLLDDNACYTISAYNPRLTG